MSTEVKFFHNGMVGAPALSGTAGALLSVLDACLVDGFDTKSVTSGSITGGIATINWSGSFSGEEDAVVLVAGLTPSGLNGERRVLTKAGTSLTFATAEADGSITVGSGTVKMAPLGWAKPHTGTNKRCYVSSDAFATGCVLRVDDSAPISAISAVVKAYETMTDVDTGANLWTPSASTGLAGDGYVWGKSLTANGTVRNWLLVGDGRQFHLCIAPQATDQYCIYTFGDFLSFMPGDAWNCMVNGAANESSVTNTTAAFTSCMGYSQGISHATNLCVARSHSALAGAVSGAQVSGYGTANGYSGSVSTSGGMNNRNLAFPNGPNNGLVLNRVMFHQSGSPQWHIRGIVPGVFHTIQNAVGAGATHRTKLDGTGDFSGKRFLIARPGCSSGSSNIGACYFDISGPWR